MYDRLSEDMICIRTYLLRVFLFQREGHRLPSEIKALRGLFFTGTCFFTIIDSKNSLEKL